MSNIDLIGQANQLLQKVRFVKLMQIGPLAKAILRLRMGHHRGMRIDREGKTY